MKFLVIGVVGLWFVSAASCRADIAPQAIVLNCMNCHGELSAVEASPIPSLKRLSEPQMRQMLLDFKYDRKPASLMPRIAKGYSDEELSAVAAYLGRH